MVEHWPRNLVVVGLSPVHDNSSFQALSTLDVPPCSLLSSICSIYLYMYMHVCDDVIVNVVMMSSGLRSLIGWDTARQLQTSAVAMETSTESRKRLLGNR